MCLILNPKLHMPHVDLKIFQKRVNISHQHYCHLKQLFNNFIATTSNINTTTLINDLCPSFNPSPLSCELLQSTAWNYNFAGILDSCMYESSCTISNPQCQSNVSFDCQFGRTSTPLNTDTSSSPTVTVWYNNQVTCVSVIFTVF